jgi:hypothetical protein
MDGYRNKKDRLFWSPGNFLSVIRTKLLTVDDVALATVIESTGFGSDLCTETNK